MSDFWRIDLHIHTCHSPDSMNEPGDLIVRAREIGLDRLAITDHNSIAGALMAQAMAPDFVIVGEEISTSDGGELIAYYVREAVPSGLPLELAMRLLRDQGAVISISHPVDRWRASAMGEEKTLQIIEDVDALEVFNARCLSPGDNARAAALAKRYGKPATAGSDAHTLRELGAAYVTLPAFSADPASFRASLGQATAYGRLTGFGPHLASSYATWAKRGLKQ